MKVRGKLGRWLLLLIILAAVFYFIPQTTKRTLHHSLQHWLARYEHAVDKAKQKDDEVTAPEEHLHTQARMVVLDKQSDRYAGIETSSAKSSLFQPEIKALARVIDLAPMVAFRARYNQAQTNVNVAAVKASSAEHEYLRLKKLASDAGGVARKNVNYADAARKEAQAALAGAKQQRSDLILEARQRWGNVISSWLLAAHSEQLEKLLTRQQSLLLLTMPTEQHLPGHTSTIRVGLDDNEQKSESAKLIGPAFETDQSRIQGETYYFQVATGRLRTGMQLDAWIPSSARAHKGILVPDSAIIWYGGQAWAYVELKPGTYQRRSLKRGIVTSDGIFMQHGFKSGDKLVTSGGQMLLSQEFKWKIQDGGDDD